MQAVGQAAGGDVALIHEPLEQALDLALAVAQVRCHVGVAVGLLGGRLAGVLAVEAHPLVQLQVHPDRLTHPFAVFGGQ